MIELRAIMFVSCLMKERGNMKTSKGKYHQTNSSLACKVWDCIDAEFEHLQCWKTIWWQDEADCCDAIACWEVQSIVTTACVELKWRKDAWCVQLCSESLQWIGLKKYRFLGLATVLSDDAHSHRPFEWFGSWNGFKSSTSQCWLDGVRVSGASPPENMVLHSWLHACM